MTRRTSRKRTSLRRNSKRYTTLREISRLDAVSTAPGLWIALEYEGRSVSVVRISVGGKDVYLSYAQARKTAERLNQLAEY